MVENHLCSMILPVLNHVSGDKKWQIHEKSLLWSKIDNFGLINWASINGEKKKVKKLVNLPKNMCFETGSMSIEACQNSTKNHKLDKILQKSTESVKMIKSREVQ